MAEESDLAMALLTQCTIRIKDKMCSEMECPPFALKQNIREGQG